MFKLIAIKVRKNLGLIVIATLLALIVSSLHDIHHSMSYSVDYTNQLRNIEDAIYDVKRSIGYLER